MSDYANIRHSNLRRRLKVSIMIKRSISQEYITIVKVFISNHRAENIGTKGDRVERSSTASRPSCKLQHIAAGG